MYHRNKGVSNLGGERPFIVSVYDKGGRKIMHNYTRDDIFHIVEEEDVAFIRLQFTDIFGTMKNMAVTVGQLE